MLSDEQKCAYLNEGGSRCPFCNSDQIEGAGSFEYESGSIWQYVRCLACDREWTDVYTLTDVEDKDEWNRAGPLGPAGERESDS